jgi:hypothetical protein
MTDADYHGICSMGENTPCPHEAERDAMREVETTARHYSRNKHQCSARYEQRACTCGYGALRDALARLDATREATADATADATEEGK